MLENELYLGNTINMRFSSKSYKDKRKVEHPREEFLVFEGTPPALVTQEIWDIVQRVRKNKRRRTNRDEQNNFTCRTYKKKGAEVRSAHYIRECVLDEVVLEVLRRMTAMARDHTREFAEYISSRQSTEIRKDIRKLEKDLSAMRKRSAELDTIFKKSFEQDCKNLL